MLVATVEPSELQGPLGSFGINGLREKSHVKYRAIRCITSMHIDTGCNSP